MTTPSADQPSLTDDVHPPCRHGVDRAYFTCPVCDEAEGYVAKPFDDTAEGLRAEGWTVELVRPADEDLQQGLTDGAGNYWWDTRDNVVLTAHWLADNGRDAKEVAYCVEKPWKFTDEYRQALAEIEAES